MHRCPARPPTRALVTAAPAILRGLPRLGTALASALLAAVWAAGTTAQEPTPWTENTVRVDPAAAPAPANIADLAWVAGHWVGEALGGLAEEVWMPPRAGRMVGAFTLVQGGEPRFHELMAIVEEAGSLVLRIKHFNPDLTGWEPADSVVTFPLARMAADTAWFDGLTFVRQGPDRLRIFLVITSEGTGKAREAVFEYRRS